MSILELVGSQLLDEFRFSLFNLLLKGSPRVELNQNDVLYLKTPDNIDEPPESEA